MDDPLYATIPKKAMSEMEATSMQKVGMREDNAKEMCDP